MRLNENTDRKQRAPATVAGTAVFDPDIFADFVDLLGPAQSASWLDRFSEGLRTEFAPGTDTVPDVAGSRAAIHKFCAQAGLIGFASLHERCLGYLEIDADHGDAVAAYDLVREEARNAITEIARQRALML